MTHTNSQAENSNTVIFESQQNNLDVIEDTILRFDRAVRLCRFSFVHSQCPEHRLRERQENLKCKFWDTSVHVCKSPSHRKSQKIAIW